MADLAVSDIAKLYSSKETEETKLSIIEKLTRSRLSRLLKLDVGATIPAKFDDIVFSVVMARFARLGNEGMKSYQQEGLSMSFPDDDFAPYMDEINSYVNGDEYQKPKRGGYLFL